MDFPRYRGFQRPNFRTAQIFWQFAWISRKIYSAKIKSIQVVPFTLERTRMKVHWCLMHVWKHGPSGYIARQTIFDCYVTDEWCDISNTGGVVFSFHRQKPWKSQKFKARKMLLCKWTRKLGHHCLQSYTDEPIFTKLKPSNRLCPVYQGCKESAEFWSFLFKFRF